VAVEVKRRRGVDGEVSSGDGGVKVFFSFVN
jgi:hypothetical protein